MHIYSAKRKTKSALYYFEKTKKDQSNAEATEQNLIMQIQFYAVYITCITLDEQNSQTRYIEMQNKCHFSTKVHVWLNDSKLVIAHNALSVFKTMVLCSIVVHCIDWSISQAHVDIWYFWFALKPGRWFSRLNWFLYILSCRGIQ